MRMLISWTLRSVVDKETGEQSEPISLSGFASAPWARPNDITGTTLSGAIQVGTSVCLSVCLSACPPACPLNLHGPLSRSPPPAPAPSF
jgi:hypothetical protein